MTYNKISLDDLLTDKLDISDVTSYLPLFNQLYIGDIM